MCGDHGHNASRAEDKPSSARLLEGICRFLLHLGSVLVNKRILPDAAADYTIEKLLSFGQGGEGFAIMPVHNLEIQRIDKREGNIMPVQMEQIAPELL